MANYDSNYAIAQLISARLGNSPIPFDSVYSICLLIYQELGGVEQDFDSVYSILLEILPLIDGGIASKVIDDTSIRYDRTWSSHKIASELANAGFDVEIVTELPSVGDHHTIYFILKQDSSTGDYYDEWMYINNSWEKVGNTAIDLSDYATIDYVDEQIEAVIGAANSEIEGKQTEDFTFAQTLPVSGEEDQLVIIKGDNTDTLYKYVSGAWVEQTPDANKLYFDVENEALYSYVTAQHQFAPVSLVNTIVVGSNLNNNADLKALKTPGVYSVVQRLHNATKGDYVKNWTLYVESVDYEEYDRSDSVYQRLVSNYTIQKRTWSATRATNDGWSSFSTYYTGEIKDSTVSKYYTWSSNKLNASLGAKQDALTSGENISIENNKVNALGYKFANAFIELPETITKMEQQIDPSQVNLNDVQLSGAAGATTYSYSGTSAEYFSQIGEMLVESGIGVQINGVTAFIQSVDSANTTVTLYTTLDADNAIQNQVITAFVQNISVLISGAANTTTYTVNDVDSMGIMSVLSDYVTKNLKISVGSYPLMKVISVNTNNNTITLESTLDANNTVSNAALNLITYNNNIASNGAHAEGKDTEASGIASHTEGYGTRATGRGSHTEGIMFGNAYYVSASGDGAHAEGECTVAQNKAEHAEGRFNKSHKINDLSGLAGNTQHSIGIGDNPADNRRKNAIEVMQNGDQYIIGVGGYEGTDTKVQNASIMTVQEVINSKADAYEVATLADIEALFAEPVPPTQPNDEIWYTTNNDQAITIDPESVGDYFDKLMLSNTYSDGKGIIKFDGDLTSILNGFSFITEDYDNITSIQLPESVTSLANYYDFANCSNLVSVKLPSNYTGGIGEGAFSECSSLESIEIPEGTTYISDSAFAGCSSFTTITIPSNVGSIAYGAFSRCSSLESIICEPTTPPDAGGHMFEDTNNCPIYVPAESVNAYKTAENWTDYANRIEAIQ